MSQCGIGKIPNPFGGRPQDPKCVDDVAWQIKNADKSQGKKTAKKPRRTKSRSLRLSNISQKKTSTAKDSYQKCEKEPGKLVFRNPFNGKCSSVTLGKECLAEAWKGLGDDKGKNNTESNSGKKINDFWNKPSVAHDRSNW